jgi:hypothetical protein
MTVVQPAPDELDTLIASLPPDRKAKAQAKLGANPTPEQRAAVLAALKAPASP